jgi:hypothetical protein
MSSFITQNNFTKSFPIFFNSLSYFSSSKFFMLLTYSKTSAMYIVQITYAVEFSVFYMK